MRTMSAAFLAAIEEAVIYPVYFMEAEFGSGTLNLWTGRPGATYQWDSKTWTAVGQLVGFSSVEETGEIKATSLTIGLPATPTLVSLALSEIRRNKPITIWLGLMTRPPPYVPGESDAGVGEDPYAVGELSLYYSLIEDPLIVFSGLCDIAEVDVIPNKPAIRIRYESQIADLERSRSRRATHEDQQIDFPGDMFYQYVGLLTDKRANWGGTS